MAKNEPMGVKKAAKTAQKKKEELARFKEPHYSTRELAVKNTRKLKLDEKVFGVSRGSLNKTQQKAANVMQARREAERTRTASRAKGVAARQTKAAQVRRQKRSLGN
jgi:hypothetical protein